MNQWKGESYLFKQVSPTVQYNYGANAVLPADGTNDPVRYLGDEKWIWKNNDTGAGSYNYVLDPKIREKKLPEGEVLLGINLKIHMSIILIRAIQLI